MICISIQNPSVPFQEKKNIKFAVSSTGMVCCVEFHGRKWRELTFIRLMHAILLNDMEYDQNLRLSVLTKQGETWL